jgi:hypothetical protein
MAQSESNTTSCLPHGRSWYRQSDTCYVWVRNPSPPSAFSLRPDFYLLGIAVHSLTSARLEKSLIADNRNCDCRRSLI